MHVLWNIIVLIVIGLIAGFVARAVIPGRQHMSIPATIGLGLIGSLVGDLLGALIFAHAFVIGFAGVVGSIIGAIIVLGIYVAATHNRHRTLTR